MLITFSVIKRKFFSALFRIRRFFVSQRFGISPDLIYGHDFYDGGGFSKTRESAEKIAVFFQEIFSPARILDIGCGPGEYLRAFSNLGIEAVGCDGASNGVRRVSSAALAFVHDLRKPLVFNKKFDLVMCIEVAEHLPKSSSATLVGSICENSNDVIVFTAAPPGCPGDDHINCQPIQFWSELFLSHGFQIDESMTEQLRTYAAANDLAQWWQGWSYVFKAVPGKR